MRLDIDEFIRRFLLHVLSKGFVRIRHYGLLASTNVATGTMPSPAERILPTEAVNRGQDVHQLSIGMDGIGLDGLPSLSGPFDTAGVVRSARSRNNSPSGGSEFRAQPTLPMTNS